MIKVSMEELLRADERSDHRFRAALRRFLEVAARRRRRFEQRKHQGETSSSRMFVLSDTEEPWRVFPAMQSASTATERRLRIQRFVYEWSDVHLSALHRACASGDRNLVRQVLREPQQREPRCSQPCTLARDSCGRIPLHHAAIREQHRVVRLLMRRSDAKVQARIKDTAGLSSAHYVLLKLAALAHRRSSGAPVPPATMRGSSRRLSRLWRTADLLVALAVLAPESSSSARCEDSESLRMLDMRCRGDEWDAVRSGDLERLEFLFRVYCATPARRQLPVLHELQRSLLHEACDSEQVPVVCYLVSQCRSSRLLQDTSGCTALHYAAMRGCLEACVLLLEDESDEGGDREDTEALSLCVDKRGRTALHWSVLSSATSCSASVATYLATKCTAALHIYDDDGFAPLHYAVWRGDLALVRVFVELGAAVNATAWVMPVAASGWGEMSKSSKTTAPWAPCGARFQSAAKKARASAAEITLQIPTMRLRSQGSVSSSSSSDIGAMDTLWYWLRGKTTTIAEAAGLTAAEEGATTPQRSSASHSSDRNQCTRNNDRRADTPESEDTGSAAKIGCSKYGGVCPKCVDFTDSEADDVVAASACASRRCAMSPLVLAVQVCARRAETTKLNRVKIVELLLASGADPNDGAESDTCNERRRSPLSAALLLALESPQPLSLLLEYGAASINLQLLERFCWSSESSAVESVLINVLKMAPLGISDTNPSASLLATMFATQRFNVLARVTSQSGYAIVWSAVHAGVSRSKAPKVRAHLDREHLWFLLECLEQQTEETTCALRGLLQQCVGWCLEKWRRASDLSGVGDEHERHERQRMALRCLRHLTIKDMDDLPSLPPDPATLREWTDHCVALGFFECALALVDVQLAPERACCVSLDRVFRVFGREAAWSRHSVGQLPDHQEFLSAMVRKITLRVAAGHGAASEHQTPAAGIVTLESVAHACANNLPLELISSLLDHALSSSRSVRVGRVRGKTLAEWVVAHPQCKALIQLLLERSAVSLKASGASVVVLWEDLVCAVATMSDQELADKRLCSRTELLRWLVSQYLELDVRVKGGGGDGLRSDSQLLTWLILERAVQCDSVLLFTAVIEPLWDLLHARVPDLPKQQESASHHSLSSLLLQTNFFAHIARWNALQVAAYTMTQLFAAHSGSESAVRWRDELVGAARSDDDLSPLGLCNELGHAELAELFLEMIATADQKRSLEDEADLTPAALDSHDAEAHGLLRTILRLNAREQEYSTCIDRVPPSRNAKVWSSLKRLGVSTERIVSISWAVASAFNLVTHLEALRLHRVPVASPPNSSSEQLTDISALVQLTIECGSVAALRWWLDFAAKRAVAMNALVEAHARLFDAASKHPSDTHATMTLLLLDAIPYTGRVAGDGTDTTLLHRCATFSNRALVEQALSKVLAIPGSSINVHDGFGHAPVVYAFLSGNVASVLALVSRRKFACRLENEYEGQSCFYYTLQLAPSFAWRWVLQTLLVEKCERRFLHCDGSGDDDEGSRGASMSSCGCKGFEHECGELYEHRREEPCSFCGHNAEQHYKVPFPPWFMDQYETYLGAKQAPPADGGDTESSNGEQDGDEENRGRAQQVDELALENERGRLDIAALTAITRHKYAGLAKDFELSALDDHALRLARSPSDVNSTADPPLRNGNDTEDRIHDEEAVAQDWPIFPLVCLASDDEVEEPIVDAERTSESESDDDDTSSLTPSTDVLPWHLQSELTTSHPPSCRCQSRSDLVTEMVMWKYQLVSRWLWVFATRCSSGSSTSVLQSTTPMCALKSSKWAVRVAFSRWRKDTLRLRAAETQKTSRLHHLLATGNDSARLVRKLQQFLSHWQFANALVAFHRWKRARESTSVRQQRLETELDDIVAQMRHARLAALRAKQLALQREIAAAGLL